MTSSDVHCLHAFQLAFPLGTSHLRAPPPPHAHSPLFSCLSSSCSRSVCRLPSTKARKERMRALRMPMMARMYAQRTEQSPREYFPVLAPHMSRMVSASQPSGKIMQPSTRHRAAGARGGAHGRAQGGREKGLSTPRSPSTTTAVQPPQQAPPPPLPVPPHPTPPPPHALPINPGAC